GEDVRPAVVSRPKTVRLVAAGKQPAKVSGKKEPAAPAEGFPFPADRGGKLVAELLRPTEKLPPAGADSTARPKPLPGPRALEQPEPPRPAAPPGLPRAAPAGRG